MTATASHLPERGRDRIIALVLFLAFLGLYWSTLCPTVFWYDSAEYTAAAVTLGIPHPPGYPLYTLLGRLFVFLPLEPAYAINLLSAVFGALTVTLVWATLRQLGVTSMAALIGAATLGAGHVYWNQCVIAEVYTPGLAFIVGVLLLLLRGLQKDRGGLMILAAGLAGLGLGVHLFIATCGLGFALLVWGLGLPMQRPGDLGELVGRRALARRTRIALACLVATLIGSCIFVYVPLRASMGPELNFENPSNFERFSWFVTGGNYKTWFLHDYPLYERMLFVLGIFYEQFLVVGLILSALGLVFLFQRQAHIALGLALMIAGNIYFFFNYRVHDVEVFFLPTVVVICILVGLGAHAVVTWLKESPLQKRLPHLGGLACGILLLFPVTLVVVNYRAVDLSSYTAARQYGEQLCAQLPQNATILNFTTPPEWKNDAVFALYFQKVLRRRRDVRVRSRVSPLEVLRMLHQGKPVFVYFPVPQVRMLFEVEREGVAYRVTRPKKPGA